MRHRSIWGGGGGRSLLFLTWTLSGGEWSASCLEPPLPQQDTSVHPLKRRFVYHTVILVLPEIVEHFPRIYVYFIYYVILRILGMKADLMGAKEIEERYGAERDVCNSYLILCWCPVQWVAVCRRWIGKKLWHFDVGLLSFFKSGVQVHLPQCKSLRFVAD